MENMQQLLIKGANVVTGTTTKRKDVLIINGKIEKIAEEIITEETKHVRVIDAENLYLLPGLIDPHVHCRDPGYLEKEDFGTASQAALAGGITTIIDMPNTNPPTFTLKDLEEKREKAKKADCNVLFYFGTNGRNLDEIKKAEQEPDVVATKLYMNITTGNHLIENTEMLEKIFQASSFLALHAEGEELKKAIELAIKYKRKVYVCHLATAEDLETISEARKLNNEIYVEVTPHHLFLTEEDQKKQGAFCSMKPTLKTYNDQKELWTALLDNKIDTIGTDHAPHMIVEKQSPVPPFGVPGLDTVLTLMLDAVYKKKLTITQLVRLAAENPAKIFNIKNKGKIEEGYDADLVLINMEKKINVDNEKLKTKCRWSPFNGWILQGWPVMTIKGGKIVWQA